MPISFLAACRPNVRVYGLVLDEYLLRLSNGLWTLRGSEPKGDESQYYPQDGKVVAQPHRVGRKGEELVVQWSEQDEDGQHREHAMQEYVELVPALAEVENDAAQAHSHIHQDNHDGDRCGYYAEAADGVEHSPEHEGNNQGEYRLRYGCHVRRAVFRGVRPNALGRTSMRPMAYITRVAAFTPAFALAIALFTMARKIMIHPIPQYLVAMVVQGSGFSI